MSAQTSESKPGPKTGAGKANSSRNSLKSGLFTARDYIAPGEEDEYTQTREAVFIRLNPADILEESHASEILGAHWRLRRCGLLETQIEDLTSNEQKSVDRARAAAQNAMRRASDQLSKLQTETRIRFEILPEDFDRNELGLAEIVKILRAKGRNAQPEEPQTEQPQTEPTQEQEVERSVDELIAGATAHADKHLLDSFKKNGLAGFPSALEAAQKSGIEIPESMREKIAAAAQSDSFCKPSNTTVTGGQKPGRNTPCPCKSGLKYKKCCFLKPATEQNQAA